MVETNVQHIHTYHISISNRRLLDIVLMTFFDRLSESPSEWARNGIEKHNPLIINTCLLIRLNPVFIQSFPRVLSILCTRFSSELVERAEWNRWNQMPFMPAPFVEWPSWPKTVQLQSSKLACKMIKFIIRNVIKSIIYDHRVPPWMVKPGCKQSSMWPRDGTWSSYRTMLHPLHQPLGWFDTAIFKNHLLTQQGSSFVSARLPSRSPFHIPSGTFCHRLGVCWGVVCDVAVDVLLDEHRYPRGDNRKPASMFVENEENFKQDTTLHRWKSNRHGRQCVNGRGSRY